MKPEVNGVSQTTIYNTHNLNRIIAYIDYLSPVDNTHYEKDAIVDTSELKWNTHEDETEHLTLEEISSQLEEKGYERPFYVWTELGLSGKIYMYGNYNPPTWEEHGTTKGYA